MVLAAGIASSAAPAVAGEIGHESIHFAVIGDRTGSHQSGVYEEILAEIQRLRPELAVTVGDAVEGYTDDTVKLNTEWNEYKGLFKDFTAPVYFTPGNHDILSDAQQEFFRTHVAQPYYSFDYKKLHFIILQNTRWEKSSDLPSAQINWLIDDLQKNQGAHKTFVFMHKPFWYATTALGQPDTLHALFKKYHVSAVFTGHFHRYFSGSYDGIIYTGIGSSGGETEEGPTGIMYHFCWVTVDGDDITIAPIKKDAVLAWDDVSVDEFRFVIKMKSQCIDIPKVTVGDDLNLANTPFEVVLHNFSRQPLVDTLRWTPNAAWTVQPAASPVSIPPGGCDTVKCAVSHSGDLYPTPSASLPFNTSKGKAITAYGSLPIAREAACAKTSKPPVLDGVLDDPCWKNPISRLYSPDGGPILIDPVEFYFAYDNKNLYIAARCHDKSLDSLKAVVTKRDGAVGGDDCVGFFFQPDLSQKLAYQFNINTIATIFDQKISFNEDGEPETDPTWNGQCKIKTGRGADYWTIEVAIPLDQFHAVGKPGLKWGLNFRRRQPRFNSFATWQAPVDYDPITYGVLIFK
jgi:hypothetical protein